MVLPASAGNKYKDPWPDFICREEDLEHSAVNGMSSPNPSPQGSGNPAEEETERVYQEIKAL